MAEGLKQKGANYSIDEDVALCRAWIIISKDPIIGNCQSSGTMWNQIRDQFIQFHPYAQEVRSSKSLKLLWMNISQMSNKFSELLMQNDFFSRGLRKHSSLTTIGMLSNMLMSGNPSKGSNPPPFVNASPMSESIYVDDDSPYESVPETQALPQTSNPRRMPMIHKKAKELKRKAIVEESSQDDKKLKEIMRSYKDCMIENKELKVMFKDTATIQTPARRRWV
ncbi:hypothetical protein ACE6H2_001341 [Prunus campanulata]